MRRLIWLMVLAIALALPAVGFALSGSGSNDGTLSVKAGIGRVYVNFNGSAVGRIQHGFIQVTDPVASDGMGFDFSGCTIEYDKTDTTTICRGNSLRFRAIGGKFQILIKGTGIYLSAVGEGYTVLNGAGDDPNIDSDGTYSLNDGLYKSLPDLGKTFTLAAPVGG